MGKFNKLSIIIITLMVCVFGSLIIYFALFKNNDDVNVNINNSHNSNLSNNISGNNTNTTPVVKDDIKYLVIDEYCILYNKTKNKFSYCKNSSVENKKLNVYIDGNYYGIYNLKYGTVWNLFDDNNEYVNYEGSLLAYSDGLNLENVSFTAEDFNSQYITEANKVLNNSKVNVQENLHYNYRYSTGNMDVTIVSNLYGEQTLYYNLAYLTYLNENYVIFKHTTNNLKSEYSYTLKSILKINNKIYIVFNMLNESNLKETFSMYEFNGSKFTKVI